MIQQKWIINKENLFYVCSLIETISQTNSIQKRSYSLLKNDSIKHINDYADTYALKQSTDEIYSKKK